MSPYNSVSVSALESLADFIFKKKDVILDEWMKTVKRSNQKSPLSSFSHKKFLNDLPLFLVEFRNELRFEKSYVSQIAKQHGEQRWEHGIDLRELNYEWRVLHLLLMECIYESRESISINHSSLHEAQRRLAKLIHKGIRLSTERYFKLRMLEAEGQLQDLQSVVDEHDELMAQRGRSLQGASHDMKGSMHVLRMSIQLLSRKEFDSETEDLIKRLSMAADGLHQLLKNLIDLSRLEAGGEELEIERFDAAELLQSLCNSLETMADQKNLKLRTKGPSSLTVRGDRLKIQRVVQNLLLNSLKYTEEGFIEVTWERMPDENWQVIVSDTGPGFGSSKEFLHKQYETKATDMNNSTDIKMHSEGIGLMIVRRLCNIMDAVLEMESEPGEGTVFTINFPADYPDHPE